ncbi:MAG: phage terminase large subunit, partial [Nitrososphaerales archaeon]
HELLLSGSVGSAKSLTLAHLIVTHCILYPGAAVGLGRLALPRLKETLCQKIREHLFEVGGGLTYKYNGTTGALEFNNGSRCIPFSWADKNYMKFRSYELSAMAIEELSENKGDHWNAYLEAYSRVGRLTHVPEKWVISASNPDSPTHPAYKHFMKTDVQTRHVYYSLTSENPFLPKSYIGNLLSLYDERMARRMIYGEWIEIDDEVVYYTYRHEQNYRDYSYQVNPNVPVCVAFDFNIALGKPLSIAFCQHMRGQTHVFNEIVIEGLRTREALREAKEKGLFKRGQLYKIDGDATGRHRDTRNNMSDYDIIEEFMTNEKLMYDMNVSRSNPPVKERHNLVNGRIKNAKGEINLYVYKDAPMADEGFRLTALKSGASYTEDDSKPYQHITTAIGYSVCEDINVGDYEPAELITRLRCYTMTTN